MPKDEMNIHEIEGQHLPQLAALYQQLLPNEVSLEKMRVALAKTRDDPDHVVLGATVDGELVGTVLGVACQMLFGQCRSFMVVEDVVVAESRRRSGVGRALMAAMEERARERDCSYIMLITDHDRPAAHRFYESLGYASDPYRGFQKRL